jgi:heme A synthase
MREYRLALATACATFVLLVIGGLVHATGSSLACPDWPLCYGQFFPKMEGGILYEHGHRLAALGVAILTALTMVLVFRARADRAPRRLAALAVALVVVQALLGGITVILKLPLLVSSSHLATSMAFFTVVLVLAHRLRPAGAPRAPPGPRGLVGLAALATYLQIVLGALVRHTGAGLACNTRIPLCDGLWWPSGGPAQLHMAHRLLGVALAALVLAGCLGPLRAARRDGRRLRAGLALAAPGLVAVQVALGLWTVTSFISIPVVTLHLAVGALLLADLVALFLSLGGAGAAESRSRPVAGLAHAAG